MHHQITRRDLGMPVKIAPYMSLGQIRLEDANGLQYPVMFDTPATPHADRG